jgi:hypothetical protein
MTPFGSVVQHSNGSPSGTCQPGGHVAHVGVVGVGGGQSHGGHCPEFGGHAGHEKEPPLLPVPAGPPQAVLPFASVWQHSPPGMLLGGEYQPGGHG